MYVFQEPSSMQPGMSSENLDNSSPREPSQRPINASVAESRDASEFQAESVTQPNSAGPTKSLPRFNVVLYQPEIPQNTGNIGRTCVAMECKLWIVRPTGFRIDDKQLQRAGLDYWQYLDWEAVDSWDHMLQIMDLERMWLFTKFGEQKHTDVSFAVGDWLVFGSETSGLPQSVRSQFAAKCVKLPMTGPVRSLNLAVSVGVGVFEANRQCGG